MFWKCRIAEYLEKAKYLNPYIFKHTSVWLYQNINLLDIHSLGCLGISFIQIEFFEYLEEKKHPEHPNDWMFVQTDIWKKTEYSNIWMNDIQKHANECIWINNFFWEWWMIVHSNKRIIRLCRKFEYSIAPNILVFRVFERFKQTEIRILLRRSTEESYKLRS